ncbi:MAG: creatininase family protein [Candidatus Undinarchaeales archaeon]|nr:creatininase family protein [Candidatus Undinarchaeales archaeon]MDP7491752.1 creatininase family protein [Candidatus Undinarchaeales archaeon]
MAGQLPCGIYQDAARPLVREGRAVLPVGAIEEHGPHLPSATDTIIATALARRVADRTGAICLPALPYGYCRTTARLPGTVSIGFDALRAVVHDIVTALADGGVSGIVVITGHGGSAHLTALQEAMCTALQGRVDVKGAVLTPWTIAIDDLVETPTYHAGETETSLMLAIAPELVDMALARPGQEIPKKGFTARPAEPVSGVWGDPTLASATKGEAVLERLTEVLICRFEELLPIDEGIG